MSLLDSRTRGNRLLKQLLASAAGAALPAFSPFLYGAYSNYKTSFKGRRPRRAMARFRRRKMYRKSTRGRRRGRKGVSSRFIAGRGPYQKRARRIVNKKLNNNLTRNDYDSTRELVNKGVLLASTTAIQTGGSNFAVYDMPLASSKMFDYDEYKVANIQLVMTPLNLPSGSNDLELSASTGEPYIYIVPRIHSEAWTSTPSIATLKSTPGVMRFHMLSKKPMVINLMPTVELEQTVIASSAGTTYDIATPFKKLGWLHQPQDSGPVVDSNYPNLGSIRYYIPQIATGSFQPKWKIEYYATVYLRGNRALAEV